MTASPSPDRRVTAPSAPLRREPRPDAALDTEALGGERVEVLEGAGAFVRARLPDGYVGYLPAAALGDPDPAPGHRVVAPRTFVYPGPDLKLPPLAFLSLGATLALDGRDSDYARLASGGFVFARHLAPLDRPEPDFVTVAESLAGTPYLWGGKTSLGIDCSGLVQLAMGVAGLNAPRDSRPQSLAIGAPLPHGEGRPALRRGDLVFWSGHVGIMRDPETLLHANGHHMSVASEALAAAEARIAATSDGPVVAIRRPERLGGS